MVKAMFNATGKALIILVVAVLIREYFGVSLMGFVILIPIGGFLIAYNLAASFNKSLYKSHKCINKVRKRIITVLCILLFVGLYYGEYKLSYKNDFFDFDKKFEESSIQTDYNFFEYVNHELRYKTFDYARIHEIDMDSFESGFNFVYFSINIILFLLGIGAYNTTYSDYKFCEECNKYYSKKTIAGFNGLPFDKLKDLRSRTTSDLGSIIIDNPIIDQQKMRADEYIEVILNYCEECQSSYLEFILVIVNNGKVKKTVIRPGIIFSDSSTVRTVLNILEGEVCIGYD